jgi:hypothetical protein
LTATPAECQRNILAVHLARRRLITVR